MRVSALPGLLARSLVRSLARFYYPRIAVDGAERIPPEGPLLLAANHPNSLLDPVLLGIAARRPVRLLAKAPLFSVPVFGPALHALGMIPAYRGRDNARDVTKNLESLARAAEALRAGAVVGIFPEGKSHDDLQVAQVRSGAARLAMQAVQLGTVGLQIVPIGLNYERKEGFRTAVWVAVGEPVDAGAWLAAHDGDEHKAMRALTAELDARLKQVVVHLDDASWSGLLAEVEGLLAPVRRRQALETLRFRKVAADAFNHFQRTDPGRVAGLVERVQNFARVRTAAGLPPQALFFRQALPRRLLAVARDAVGLGALTLFGLAGLLHHLVPHALTRLVAGRVVPRGRMTLALARLLIGLPIYGGWYTFVAVVMLRYFQPWVAIAWLVLMPWAGLAALDAGRRWRTLVPVWWAEVKLLFQPARARALREQRQTLAHDVREFAVAYPRAPESTPAPQRSRLYRPPVALTLALAGAALAAVLLIGVWLWRDRPVEFWRLDGPALHEQPRALLLRNLAENERALAQVLAGLADLEEQARAFSAALEAGEKSYYRADDETDIRRMLVSFLSYRTALLRQAWAYQRFAAVEEPSVRFRAALVHATAAAAAYDYTVRFVTTFADKEVAQRKLNEPEPQWDLPAGTYDRLRANLAHAGQRRWLEAGWREYQETLPKFEAHGIGPNDAAPYAAFHYAIRQAAVTTAPLGEQLGEYKRAAALADLKTWASGGYGRVSATLSTWIGDARLRAPRDGRPLVTPELLERLRPLLQPGDILIERRNWYLSNAFLPGYWPHAALYVGTPEQLEALGLRDDPRVAAKWAAFVRSDADGRMHAIIEAVSEGVIFTSLEHSAGEADSVAVLRPKVPQAVIREAIGRAFANAGKPYDFDFDFFSSDRLVCTEVVHRAYSGFLDLPLVPILGRQTLPAIEIVRWWAEGSEPRPLEFVALLDGNEREGHCTWSDAAMLRESLKRPGLSWLN